MNTQFAVYVLVGLALIGANLPFLNNRIFAVFSFPRLLMFELAASSLSHAAAQQTDSDQSGVVNAEFDSQNSEATLIGLGANRVRKPFWFRLVELLLLYCVVGFIGFYLEAQQGNRFPQTWQFYVTTFCLFLVLAFPGFVYQYLRRKHD